MKLTVRVGEGDVNTIEIECTSFTLSKARKYSFDIVESNDLDYSGVSIRSTDGILLVYPRASNMIILTSDDFFD